MSIFPKDVEEAANKMGGEWISALEFEQGLTLKISKPMEKVKSFNPKYGAEEKDYLVKKEILDIGETFRYHFITPEGEERKIDSKSSPMFIGFRSVEELGIGDWIHVKRTGKTDQTRFTVEKVDAPSIIPDVAKPPMKAGDYPKEELNSEDIPF